MKNFFKSIILIAKNLFLQPTFCIGIVYNNIYHLRNFLKNLPKQTEDMRL